MSEHTTARVVPPCPRCGKPLGLYYMDCLWCYGHANEFSYSDYANATPPREGQA